MITGSMVLFAMRDANDAHAHFDDDQNHKTLIAANTAMNHLLNMVSSHNEQRPDGQLTIDRIKGRLIVSPKLGA